MIFKFIYLKRESMSRGGAERERQTDREDPKQAPHCTQSPAWGSIPQTARSRPEPKPGVRHSTDRRGTRCPEKDVLNVLDKAVPHRAHSALG